MTTDVAPELQEIACIDDPEFYLEDPRPIYARLRREAPVFWYERTGVWALSRYADICSTERQATLFTSTRGAFMGQIPSAPPPLGPGSPLPDYTFSTDPPNHTRFRKVLTYAFTPQAIAQREDGIRQIVRETLDSLPDGQPFDFVESVSIPITINVIAEVLGVPRSDWLDFKRWSDARVDLLEMSLSEEEKARVMTEIAELEAYINDQLEQRLSHPRDDILTTMAHATIDGQEVPRSAQIRTCRGLLAAGNETTRNALSAGMILFAENPDQWERLKLDRSLSMSATDEVLRYASIQLHFMRAATEDTIIANQAISAGDFVVLLYGSGNFDDEAFPDPELFDIGRSSHPAHLAFGFGPHRCLGATLARQEIRFVLEETAQRFKGWDLAGEVVRSPSTVVATYDHVPVSFHAS